MAAIDLLEVIKRSLNHTKKYIDDALKEIKTSIDNMDYELVSSEDIDEIINDIDNE